MGGEEGIICSAKQHHIVRRRRIQAYHAQFNGSGTTACPSSGVAKQTTHNYHYQRSFCLRTFEYSIFSIASITQKGLNGGSKSKNWRTILPKKNSKTRLRYMWQQLSIASHRGYHYKTRYNALALFFWTDVFSCCCESSKRHQDSKHFVICERHITPR